MQGTHHQEPEAAHAGGTVEVEGEPPPPLCDACPERDNPKAPIRHMEVLHGFPPGGGVRGVQDIENAVRIKLVYDDVP